MPPPPAKPKPKTRAPKPQPEGPGAPEGNTNARKYSEPTEQRTVRLPLSTSHALSTAAKSRKCSAAEIVTELLQNHLPSRKSGFLASRRAP